MGFTCKNRDGKSFTECYHNFNKPCGPSSDSAWGMRNTELVTAQSPDLVVIAFGMNESSSTDSYKNNIVSIINSVTQPNAAAEFLLVSAFTPNTTAKTFQNNQLAVQEELLYNIRSELNNINIAVAPVNSMCREMLSMEKRIGRHQQQS